MSIKRYSELIQLPTFEERFNYLKFSHPVGETTFGFNRWLNQVFYRSKEWKDARRDVIIRDNGCDLGDPDHPLPAGTRIIVHHLNIITIDDIDKHSDVLIDPEYLITTCHATHNAIHYGDESQLILPPAERRPNDTCPWR